MRLWIARKSEVPIREQLVTQIVLGILSGDLRKGQRLPSTRELARRYQIHANTVSAAYRELEQGCWVEFRRGSGVFIRIDKRLPKLAPRLELDRRIAMFFRSAQETGVPLAAVRARLRHWLSHQPPDHFLVIEPDEELRRIVAHEVRTAVDFPVAEAGFEACKDEAKLECAMPVVLPSKAEAVRKALPAGTDFQILKPRSVTESLAGWLPAPADALIAVASSWPAFLTSARTMLLAAGFDADALVFRDARKPRWQDGLKAAKALICDSLTARDAPRGCRVIVFPVISETSLAELRAFRDFVTHPLR